MARQDIDFNVSSAKEIEAELIERIKRIVDAYSKAKEEANKHPKGERPAEGCSCCIRY